MLIANRERNAMMIDSMKTTKITISALNRKNYTKNYCTAVRKLTQQRDMSSDNIACEPIKTQK